MKELKQYSYICWVLAINSVKVRYKNSFFGVLWGFLNPLALMYIFIFVFSGLFSDIENYPLYLLSGLIFWYFFSGSSNEIVFSFIRGSSILKSIAIPRIILPLSGLIANLIHLFFTLVPFFLVMHFYGLEWTFHLLFLIPAVLLFAVFTLGLSLILASVNVYFRDISMMWSTLLLFIFYCSPVVYGRTIVPERYDFIMKYNPITYFMQLFRDALHANQISDNSVWLGAGGMSLLFLIIGLLGYSKLQKGFVSNLG
ncbi:MAG: ABC transporter permease [Cyclobacteriaceae bacterium]